MKLHLSGLICLILIVSAFRADSKPDKWKLLKSKDNISSYSGTAGKNGVTPTKVEMIVRATPERTVHVIADMANYKSWVPYCKTSVLVQKPVDTLCYGYQYISAPLVKDRDVSIRCTIIKKGDKAYEISIVGVPNFVKQ